MTQTMDRAARMAMLAALCAMLAAHAALAQEAAPAGDAPQTSDGGAAAVTGRDVEPFTPQRGPAGLQRRANLRALIANAPSSAAGAPSGAVRTAPLPVRSGMNAAVQRNAIGVAMPAAQLPGYGGTGVTASAGNKPANLGIPAANIAGPAHHPPIPATSGALRTTGINGTTMGRIVAGPGSIGGPAKNLSGINGTSMPSKH